MFYDIFSLLHEKRKKIQIGVGIKRFYTIWKALLKNADLDFETDIQSFCIGYIIGNNVMLKERLLQWDRVQKKLDEQ